MCEMTAVTRWDAFHDPSAAQDQLAHLNTPMVRAAGREFQLPGADVIPPMWAPTVDITEREDSYVVTVELPGVAVGDLEIAFQDGLLTIQGERRPTVDSAAERTHLMERRHGPFRRLITLPQHVIGDAIEASAEDGVLRVVVPKAEEARPRRIEVRAARAMTLASVPRESTS
jgi:HSP20 family protein